jgi:hypothetical protein
LSKPEWIQRGQPIGCRRTPAMSTVRPLLNADMEAHACPGKPISNT